MDKYRVGVVIPAFDEALTIASIVRAVGKYGVPIVVDDGSTDATAELAQEAGAVLVVHEKNLGYDAALNSGFNAAVGLGMQTIVTVDADGQHDVSLIQQFVAAIEVGADIVVGVRSRRQRFAEHLFAFYTKIRFGIRDPLCGMKSYRVGLYEALGHFDSYGSIGTELTIFAVKNGYRMKQISFDVRDRNGQSRFGQSLSSNYKIVRAMLISICYFR